MSYEHLHRLAESNLQAALAVVNGARVECETAALEGMDANELLNLLVPALHEEQRPDSDEDCAHGPLIEALCAVAFGPMRLPARREVVERLEKWERCQMHHMDAAVTALAIARALRTALED